MQREPDRVERVRKQERDEAENEELNKGRQDERVREEGRSLWAQEKKKNRKRKVKGGKVKESSSEINGREKGTYGRETYGCRYNEQWELHYSHFPLLLSLPVIG